MEPFKKLHSYVLAVVISDLTVEFCKKFISPKSRTVDQMTQAGRSGKQNIAEGASGQSLESYIKLLGVAEASFKELAADYEDYLRQHNLITLSQNDPKLRRVRQYRAAWVATNKPNTPNLPSDQEQAANAMLSLCARETYLLGRGRLLPLNRNSSKRVAYERVCIGRECYTGNVILGRIGARSRQSS